MATVTLRGKEQHTCGELPVAGEKAPGFVLTSAALKEVSLADFAGKKKLIYTVPSLDTPVCANTTKLLNEKMADYPQALALIVSADLPFAQGRFFGAEKLKNIIALSMMRSKQFAEDYGVLLVDGPLAGLTARAVIVLDEQDRVLYSQWVKEIADEPDFTEALATLN
jgi:thiol peroxidase